MRADRLVNVVKRNLHGTEAEILDPKAQPERRKVPRVALKDNPAVEAGRDLYARRKSQPGWSQLLIKD